MVNGFIFYTNGVSIKHCVQRNHRLSVLTNTHVFNRFSNDMHSSWNTALQTSVGRYTMHMWWSVSAFVSSGIESKSLITASLRWLCSCCCYASDPLLLGCDLTKMRWKFGLLQNQTWPPFTFLYGEIYRCLHLTKTSHTVIIRDWQHITCMKTSMQPTATVTAGGFWAAAVYVHGTFSTVAACRLLQSIKSFVVCLNQLAYLFCQVSKSMALF